MQADWTVTQVWLGFWAHTSTSAVCNISLDTATMHGHGQYLYYCYWTIIYNTQRPFSYSYLASDSCRWLTVLYWPLYHDEELCDINRAAVTQLTLSSVRTEMPLTVSMGPSSLQYTSSTALTGQMCVLMELSQLHGITTIHTKSCMNTESKNRKYLGSWKPWYA